MKTRSTIAFGLLAACLLLAAPASGQDFHVRYEYTIGAEIDFGSNSQQDDAFLTGQAFVSQEHYQAGYAPAGNFAQLGFTADISRAYVGAHTYAHGNALAPTQIYCAYARVEMIGFADRLTFLVPAGDYPDGLYARLDGRCCGSLSASVAAGAKVFCMATLGGETWETGNLDVAIEEDDRIVVDDALSLTAQVVAPGAHLAVDVEIDLLVSAMMGPFRNWTVEYNPGTGYTTGSGANDFCGGLRFVDFEPPAGISWWSASGVFMQGSVAVPETPPAGRVALRQNHPNPFNPTTTIAFDLPAPAAVSLRIHDARGRLVRTLLDAEPREAGPHSLTWDGRDDRGRELPSGVYLCRLDAAGRAETRRMTLLR